MVRFVAVAALLMAATTNALAAGSCRPTRDGKDRVEVSGGCPDGYAVRGACCESLRAVSQPTAVTKTCPAGTMLRLGVCVPRQ